MAYFTSYFMAYFATYFLSYYLYVIFCSTLSHAVFIFHQFQRIIIYVLCQVDRYIFLMNPGFF